MQYATDPIARLGCKDGVGPPGQRGEATRAEAGRGGAAGGE